MFIDPNYQRTSAERKAILFHFRNRTSHMITKTGTRLIKDEQGKRIPEESRHSVIKISNSIYPLFAIYSTSNKKIYTGCNLLLAISTSLYEIIFILIKRQKNLLRVEIHTIYATLFTYNKIRDSFKTVS